MIAKRIALKISTADCAKKSVCAKIVIKSMDAQVSISLKNVNNLTFEIVLIDCYCLTLSL